MSFFLSSTKYAENLNPKIMYDYSGEAVENGYDVPSTTVNGSAPSSSAPSIVCASSTSSTNSSASNQNNTPQVSSSSSHSSSSSNKGHRGVSVNKVLGAIHQQQQQLRHQSCPALPGSSALHLSTPKSCPTSTAVSPICSQHAQLPLNPPSSASSACKSSTHVKNMPNSLALSSITSCCVMATGNKQFLPRHSLHPQTSGKTPSSSFSTRVVANKSNNNSSSAAAISSRIKGPSDNKGQGGSDGSNSAHVHKINMLGISFPFKAFPISAKIGQSSEPPEGPNYENTNLGQLNFPVVVNKERRVLPDLDDRGDTPTAPYENLNMDYISKLTNEGFTQDLVIRALGISRNDVDMARDILNEFAGSRS